MAALYGDMAMQKHTADMQLHGPVPHSQLRSVVANRVQVQTLGPVAGFNQAGAGYGCSIDAGSCSHAVVVASCI
jgi:hypothetical protein